MRMAKVQMCRKRVARGFDAGEPVTTRHALAGIHRRRSNSGIKRFAPTVLELDIAAKAAGFDADLDHTAGIGRQHPGAGRRLKVDTDMALQTYTVIGVAGMEFGVLAPGLQQQRTAFERQRRDRCLRAQTGPTWQSNGRVKRNLVIQTWFGNRFDKDRQLAYTQGLPANGIAGSIKVIPLPAKICRQCTAGRMQCGKLAGGVIIVVA